TTGSEEVQRSTFFNPNSYSDRPKDTAGETAPVAALKCYRQPREREHMRCGHRRGRTKSGDFG
ncbi:MAG: hypothetical protein WCA23_03950, partial [Stellaceae bacterium]